MFKGDERKEIQTNKQTNVFVKPRTSPFTGGHSSLALRLGPLGGARRTQMRSSALGVLPQCPRGLMLDYARHTSHCESNFGSFCRGCPTQRSRVPSSVSWVDSSRLRSCSVAASRLGFYLVSPPSSRLGSGSRLVASSRVGLAGGSWWLAVAGWCLAVSLGGSWRLVGAGWCLAGSLRMFGSTRGCLAAIRGDSWGLVMARGDWLVLRGPLGGLGSARGCLAVVFSGRPCGGLAAGWCLAVLGGSGRLAVTCGDSQWLAAARCGFQGLAVGWGHFATRVVGSLGRLVTACGACGRVEIPGGLLGFCWLLCGLVATRSWRLVATRSDSWRLVATRSWRLVATRSDS